MTNHRANSRRWVKLLMDAYEDEPSREFFEFIKEKLEVAEQHHLEEYHEIYNGMVGEWQELKLKEGNDDDSTSMRRP